MYCIGLTGGIASGKSTVVSMLLSLGAYVIDCDKLARDVVMPGAPALLDVARAFGPKALAADGTMDRAYIASVVFQKPERKKELEGILYPRMQELIDLKMADISRKDRDAIIYLDMPLLFEIKYDAYVAEAWLVYVDPETQLKRLMKRNGYSEDEAMARIHAQLPIDEKRPLAQVIIDNTGTPAETEQQVQGEWKKLKERLGLGSVQ